MRRLGLGLIALALASGVQAKGWGPKANIVRSDGVVIGTARAMVTPGGLALKLKAKGLPPGEIGMHIHEAGRCEGPDFKSAGAHWNPGGKQHGRLNPAGEHAGDLGNIQVETDGSIKMDYLPDPAGNVPNALDADGASLVIHAQRDDEQTDPSGNSGARIACAVLAPPR
ncbi:MAG TPA: superoxide dismutase family protein [Sphingomicrobium sp.]|nr:superoxide dismutase family protein [Sphingomicrobium sp.]